MDRTRPAHLVPRGFARNETDEVENVSQRNHRPDSGEVNAWHGCGLGTESRGTVGAADARTGSCGSREEEPVILLEW
jgi:hypothetical protein